MSFEIEGEALGKAIRKGQIERIHIATPSPSFRPIANAGPLGLSAFAVTTFILSVVNADLLPKEIKPTFVGPAFVYGGFIQLCAGMWEFVTNNTFGAVAFSSYGGFWMSLAYFKMYIEHTGIIAEEDAMQATGLFLLPWCFFTGYMTAAAYRTSRALFVTFALVELTLILLCAGNFEEDEDTIKAGGWVGIILAFAAWYCATAIVVNTQWREEIIPLWPYKFPVEKPKQKHSHHNTNAEHHVDSHSDPEHDLEHELDHEQEHEIKTGKSPKIGIKVK